MSRRWIWTLVFLPLTVVPIALECWAGFDNSDNTIPWTEYISRYVPWPVAITVYAVLVVWLPIHFWKHYHLRKLVRQLRSVIRAQGNAMAANRTAARDRQALVAAADRAEAAVRLRFTQSSRVLLGEVLGDVRTAILRTEE